MTVTAGVGPDPLRKNAIHPDMNAGASRIWEGRTAVTSSHEQERPRHAGGRSGAFRHPGAAQFPHAALHLIDHASHWPQWDQPAVVAEIINGNSSGPSPATSPAAQ
jgi:pimeloyl-ACP methyl ester carboxylesterase